MANKWWLNRPGGLMSGLATSQFIITYNEILHQQLQVDLL